MYKYIVSSFFILLSVSSGFAQNKIGYVSVDEIFGMIAEYQKALADSYTNQQNELNDTYAKFVMDSAKMTSAVKDFKRNELQLMISELQNKEQQLNSSLEQQKEKILKPIREKLVKAIQDVAKENGYQHVLYKESAIVFPAADDITRLVKTKLGIK